MKAIEASGLYKTYSGFFRRKGGRALDGVDLKVDAGTAFGLIGLNGAGKTTFIKTVLDVVKPDKGSIRILGGRPEDIQTRMRTGYLPERLEMPGAWTPRSFLRSICRFRGVRDFEDQIRFRLSQVGLAPEAGHRIRTFSKGMKRRLGVAAALTGSPELIVLDEPTDGIDPIGRLEVRRILEQEKKRGATIFINSHLLTETERFCDRIGIIHNGRIKREGSMKELCGDVDRWRAAFEKGSDEELIRKQGFEKETDSDDWIFVTSSLEDLNRALDSARAGGELLSGLRPDLKQLDEILAEVEGGEE